MAKGKKPTKGAKAVTKKITKAVPRQTRTIKAVVAEAKLSQPSAGTRKLPRQNRRNKEERNKKAKAAANKK